MTSVETIGAALAACRGRIDRTDARILMAEAIGSSGTRIEPPEGLFW